jgi:hypothetical protein
MFSPWIKRKSLKRTTKGKNLVIQGGPPSLIMLLSVSALVVFVGCYVVTASLAGSQWNAAPTPTIQPSSSPSPSTTPVVSGAPYSR